MSVDFLRETFGREYASKITGAKTAVKVFYCKLDTGVDLLEDVVTEALAATPPLPSLGDDYLPGSPYSGLVAVEHVPQEIDKERGFYSIKVNYESNSLNFAAPTARPWMISFSSVKEEYVPEKTLTDSADATGETYTAVGINKPVVNTAGYPFVDPPVTDVKSKVVIELRKNFLNITDIGSITTVTQLMGFVNSINTDTPDITIAGVTGTPLQFLMDDIQIANKEENGESYYEAMFRVIYDPEWHVSKVLNAGWIDVNNKVIKTPKGADLQQPALLTAGGLPIWGNLAAKQAAAIYLGFAVKPGKTFATLGLPTTF